MERGISKTQAARTFDVSLSSVKRYANKADRGESLAPKKSPGSPRKLDETASKLLLDDLAESAPLPEPPGPLRLRGGRRGGALREPLYYVPRHSPARLDPQKGGRSAAERDEFGRAAWRVRVAAAVEPERLLFVEECGLHTSRWRRSTAMRPERRAPYRLWVPRNRGTNTTLLSSMTVEGMGPSLAVEGASTARVLETNVEKVLVPRACARERSW